MSTKLVKLAVPEPLHRRIKTVAAFQDKKIPVYILEVLDDHVPTQITFPANETTPKKKPRGERPAE
jgi:hypothetical protein